MSPKPSTRQPVRRLPVKSPGLSYLQNLWCRVSPKELMGPTTCGSNFGLKRFQCLFQRDVPDFRLRACRGFSASDPQLLSDFVATFCNAGAPRKWATEAGQESFEIPLLISISTTVSFCFRPDPDAVCLGVFVKRRLRPHVTDFWFRVHAGWVCHRCPTS